MPANTYRLLRIPYNRQTVSCRPRQVKPSACGKRQHAQFLQHLHETPSRLRVDKPPRPARQRYSPPFNFWFLTFNMGECYRWRSKISAHDAGGSGFRGQLKARFRPDRQPPGPPSNRQSLHRVDGGRPLVSFGRACRRRKTAVPVDGGGHSRDIGLVRRREESHEPSASNGGRVAESIAGVREIWCPRGHRHGGPPLPQGG